MWSWTTRWCHYSLFFFLFSFLWVFSCAFSYDGADCGAYHNSSDGSECYIQMIVFTYYVGVKGWQLPKSKAEHFWWQFVIILINLVRNGGVCEISRRTEWKIVLSKFWMFEPHKLTFKISLYTLELYRISVVKFWSLNITDKITKIRTIYLQCRIISQFKHR